MKRGFLSQYFAGVAAKRLSTVETDIRKSNQHEYNGISSMKAFMGELAYGEKKQLLARFIWLGNENEGITEDSLVTWYQSRKQPRSEYRLYFRNTSVSELAREGDLLIVARQTDGILLVIVVPAGSTNENQLLWLFGISDQLGQIFEVQKIEGNQDIQVDYVVRYILEELGIEPEQGDTALFDRYLEKFEGRFPTTAEFSEHTRRIAGVAPL